MIKKLLSKGFWPKAIIGFLILCQFAGLFLFFLWLSDWSGVSPAYSLFAIVAVYAFGAVLGLLAYNSTSPSAYRLSWVLVILLLPGIGGFLYLIFGNKQNSKRFRLEQSHKLRDSLKTPIEKEQWGEFLARFGEYQGIANYLYNVHGFAPHGHSQVAYYPLGDDLFEPLLEELKKAKHYIFLEFFIIEREGVFFSSMLQIMKEKAANGVDVRIVYDDVGCLTTLPSDFASEMARYGIKAKPFNRFRPFLDVRQNNRDHRKMLIIDGHTAFTGGFNLADEYINRKERFGVWKDNGIMVKGEAVEAYTYAFLSTYGAIGSKDGGFSSFDKVPYASSVYADEIGGLPKGEGFVLPYFDMPFDGEAVGERVYLSLINSAKHRLYMATPYLLIDEEMQNAICQAAKSGVDVRLLLPHIPDKKAVFNLTRSYYGPLMEAGVRIYEFTPGLVHEKMFIVDDSVGSVGTINLDYRSLYLHFENGTLLFGDPSIAKMRQDYLQSIEKSELITKERYAFLERKNKYYWAILRIIAPFL